MDLSNDDTINVVERYFDAKSVVENQLVSFNDFVEHTVHDIFRHNSEFQSNDGNITIRFNSISFSKPRIKSTGEKLFPMRCMIEDHPYSANMISDIEVFVKRKECKNPHDCQAGRFNEDSHIFYNFPRTLIGQIPVMVKSVLCNLHDIQHDKEKLIELGECHLEPGGYFITRGTKQGSSVRKRAVTLLERISPNHIFAFRSRDRKKNTYSAEVRSTSEESFYTSSISVVSEKEKLYMKMGKLKKSVPFYIFTRALGLSDLQVRKIIIQDKKKEKNLLNILTLNREELYEKRVNTAEECVDYITSRFKFHYDDEKAENLTPADKKVSIERFFLEEFLAHLNIDEPRNDQLLRKGIFLCCMVRKCLLVRFDMCEPDDRDHLKRERIIGIGPQLISTFVTCLKTLQRDIIKKCDDKKIQELPSLINTTLFHKTITKCLNVNIWGKNGLDSHETSQLLEAINHQGHIANLRKISVQVPKNTAKIIEPRNLHGSQWGVVCEGETPEGEKCGYTKATGLMAEVTVTTTTETFMDIITSYAESLKIYIKMEDMIDKFNFHKIFINGFLVGITECPHEFREIIVAKRRNSQLHKTTSISVNDRSKDVFVWTDYGRLVRPVFILEDGKLVFNSEHENKMKTGQWCWEDLIINKIVEYIDKEEEENCVIYTSLDEYKNDTEDNRRLRTHMEIHPGIIFGLSVNIIPYPEKNQAPRITYQASMQKQAVSSHPFSNKSLIMWNKFDHLLIPQRPLVSSRFSKFLSFDETSSAFNAMVLLAPIQGSGQEDSVILNKKSVENGMGVIIRTLSYTAIENPQKGEIFCIPPTNECRRPKGNYSKLDENGIVRRKSERIEKKVLLKDATVIENGDVIIGKIFPSKNGKFSCVDDSIVYKEILPGKVDSIIQGTNSEGFNFVKITIKQVRVPIQGDKFAARYGQKGTTGRIMSPEDLPFTADGMIPDIVINTLCLPSRMTIGMIVEGIAGQKVIAKDQRSETIVNQQTKNIYEPGLYTPNARADCTAFNGKDNNIDEICDILKQLGCPEACNYEMYCGTTGRKLKRLGFMVPLSYQRLKHMVLDKVHARSTGPRTNLTRQPRGGRSEEGGMRNGVMERSCLVAHGASACVKDRFFEQSDPYQIHVCGHCGLPAVKDKKCSCGCEDIRLVKIPYSTKLVLQEFGAMGVFTRFFTENPAEVDDLSEKIENQLHL